MKDPAKNYTYVFTDKGYCDFKPIVFGEETCSSLHTNGPGKLSHFLIHYVISGKGTLTLNGKKYFIEKNTAFLIRPDDIFKYTADKNEPWHYIWIGFFGDKANGFYKLSSPIIPIKTELFSEMREVRFVDGTAEEFIMGKLFSYYSLIFSAKVKEDYISRITNYVNAYYTDFECTVQKISEIIGLERHYMARIYKKETGKTLKSVLTEKRMNNAVSLLKSGYDVKTTAQLSGYTDQFSFSRAFKDYYGCSPVSYKST